MDLLIDETNLPAKYLAELMDFGAIYIQNRNKTERYLSSMDPFKVPQGLYCRVHVNPRRYPNVYNFTPINWKNCIIHQTNNVIIIDKPYGSIPISSTVDNNKENLIEILKQILHVKSLFTIGRLDACTSGKHIVMVW